MDIRSGLPVYCQHHLSMLFAAGKFSRPAAPLNPDLSRKGACENNPVWLVVDGTDFVANAENCVGKAELRRPRSNPVSITFLLPFLVLHYMVHVLQHSVEAK